MDEKHTQRQDRHIDVYLVWPVASGVALAVVLGVSTGGLAAIVTRNVTTAFVALGVTFFIVLGIATLAVFGYAASQFGPVRIERIRAGWEGWLDDGDVDIIDAVPERPRFIPVNVNDRRKLTAPASIPQAATTSLAGRVRQLLAPPAPVIDGEFASSIGDIGPDAPEWVREFYDTTIRAYALKTLSRNAFQTTFGENGRRLHERYVAGSQDGRTRGIWDAWQILTDGARRSKIFAYDLQTILKMDADVWRYALSKNKLLTLPLDDLPDSDPNDGTLPVKSSQVKSSQAGVK